MKQGKSSRRSSVACVEPLAPRTLFSATYAFSTIASLNEAAPGHAGDTFANPGFEVGGINGRGDVGFASYINSYGSAVGEGVYASNSGNLTPIIRQGDLAPGGERYGGFGTFSPGAFNDRGDFVIGFGRTYSTSTLGVNASVYKYTAATHAVTALFVPGKTDAPTGGKFLGTGFHASINNADQVVFPAIIHTRLGPAGGENLGQGVYEIDSAGKITDVAAPGDPAPGGKVFDLADSPSIANGGYIAFAAHLKGDPVLDLGVTTFPQTPNQISASESVFLRAPSGKLSMLAHQGSAIPKSAGGGTFDYAFGPSVNSKGQVIFMGAIRQKPALAKPSDDPFGLFVSVNGVTHAVARPGMAMPGGGTFATGGFYISNWGIADRGQIAFNAKLTNGDQGVYVWQNGKLSLVAKTGTVIPFVGTISTLDLGAGRAQAPAWRSTTRDRWSLGRH